MKSEMVSIDKESIENAMKKRGYTYDEIAAELSYSYWGYRNAVNRGTLPAVRFKRLVKALNVDAETLVKKDEKPVQESMRLEERPADVLKEVHEIRETLTVILATLEAINNALR